MKSWSQTVRPIFKSLSISIKLWYLRWKVSVSVSKLWWVYEKSQSQSRQAYFGLAHLWYVGCTVRIFREEKISSEFSPSRTFAHLLAIFRIYYPFSSTVHSKWIMYTWIMPCTLYIIYFIHYKTLAMKYSHCQQGKVCINTKVSLML